MVISLVLHGFLNTEIDDFCELDLKQRRRETTRKHFGNRPEDLPNLFSLVIFQLTMPLVTRPLRAK